MESYPPSSVREINLLDKLSPPCLDSTLRFHKSKGYMQTSSYQQTCIILYYCTCYLFQIEHCWKWNYILALLISHATIKSTCSLVFKENSNQQPKNITVTYPGGGAGCWHPRWHPSFLMDNLSFSKYLDPSLHTHKNSALTLHCTFL